jgi:hypothetical protein
MTCNPHSAGGHGYIVVDVDYFTKWAEAMPTFENTRKTATLFIFNHIITRFGVPQAIVTDHESHFHNFMMSKLTGSWVFAMKTQPPIIHMPMARLK